MRLCVAVCVCVMFVGASSICLRVWCVSTLLPAPTTQFPECLGTWLNICYKSPHSSWKLRPPADWAPWTRSEGGRGGVGVKECRRREEVEWRGAGVEETEVKEEMKGQGWKRRRVEVE